ncbi:MAG: MATE family efflux transporter [Tangfeifania sp.]
MKLAEYIPFYKRNLHLAFPVVLSQIGQVLVQLVDNMMVGHVGTVELAASAFANNVFIIGMFFGMGITYGITPLVGKAFGNNKPELVVIWLKNGVLTHMIAAVLLSVLMFGAYFLLPFLGQTKDVLELSRPYYLLLCASYLPFMLFFSVKQFFEGIGNTKIAMQITLTANLINILLNYVLIFGKFGFPELGLVGAGIGTLVSRLVMPLMFVVYIIKLPRFRKYFSRARKVVFQKIRFIAVLRIGIPIAFQIVVEGITFSIGAVMMGWLGETPLAAHQVAIGLAGFTYMISLGISQATTIRISHQMGESDFISLRKAAWASTHLVLFFMSAMGIIFILAKSYLPLLFTSDTDVVAIAAQLLIVAAIFQVFDGLQVSMLGALRGMADVKIPMFMAFISYLLIGVPTSYVFTFLLGAGPQGIWYGYLVGLGSAGIFFYFRFKYNLRKKA